MVSEKIDNKRLFMFKMIKDVIREYFEPLILVYNKLLGGLASIKLDAGSRVKEPYDEPSPGHREIFGSGVSFINR